MSSFNLLLQDWDNRRTQRTPEPVLQPLSPHTTLRQQVRQFIYWQISAENHEPYIPQVLGALLH